MKLLKVLLMLCCFVGLLNAQGQIRTFPWFEGFEGAIGSVPEGWVRRGTQMNQSETRWAIRQYNNVTPYEGARFLSSIGFHNGFFNPNDWVIAPLIIPPPVIPEGRSLYLRYYVKSWEDGAPNHYGVYVATDGSEVGTGLGEVVGDFTRLFEETAPTDAWAERIIDLSAYQHEEAFFLAFRHFNTPQGNLLKVDNFWLGFVNMNAPLNPPRSLAVTSGNNEVTLNWQRPTESDATLTGYIVYRDGVAISGLLQTLTYRDFGLINGLTYQYEVEAVYTLPTGQSERVAISGTPEGPSVAAFPPRNFEGSADDGIVTLNWEHPEYDETMGPGEWITHTVSDDILTAYGFVGGMPFRAFHRFLPSHFDDFGVVGYNISRVSFVPGTLTNYSVHIWSGVTLVFRPDGGIQSINLGTEVVAHAIPASAITAMGKLKGKE